MAKVILVSDQTQEPLILRARRKQNGKGLEDFSYEISSSKEHRKNK